MSLLTNCSFRKLADFVYTPGCSLDSLKDNDKVFVKTDHIRHFLQIFLHTSTKHIYLITGESDFVIPHNFFSLNLFDSILSDDRILKWFITNCTYNKHPKIVLIPIGVYSVTVEHIQKVFDEGHVEKTLDEPFFAMGTTYTYDNISYTQPSRALCQQLFCHEKEFNKLSIDDYLQKMNKSKFVPCPVGHGPDTFRLWESIALGCIPIVESPEAMIPLLEDHGIKNIRISGYISYILGNNQLHTTEYQEGPIKWENVKDHLHFEKQVSSYIVTEKYWFDYVLSKCDVSSTLL
jgi:hypothetical protein